MKDNEAEKIIRTFATKFTENIKCSNLNYKIKSLLYIYVEDFTDLYIENHINKE